MSNGNHFIDLLGNYWLHLLREAKRSTAEHCAESQKREPAPPDPLNKLTDAPLPIKSTGLCLTDIFFFAPAEIYMTVSIFQPQP